MPKNLRRVTGLGDLHFITFCCYQRRTFLATPESRKVAMQILGEVRNKYGFALVGYVFMPQHVHLLVGESKLVSPAIAMRVFKQRVSRQMRSGKREEPALICFRKNRQRRFWHWRYYDFNVHTQAKLGEKLPYMHENPIRERLVRRASDWPWSSWSSDGHRNTEKNAMATASNPLGTSPTGTDTISSTRTTVTWIVGFAAAAVAEAFLNFEKVAATTFWVRLIYFLSAAGFGAAILCGIRYLNWLNYAANQDEKRMWADGRIDEKNTSEEDKAKSKEQRSESWKRMNRAMTFGIAFAALLLLAGVISGAPHLNPGTAGGVQNFLSNPPEPNVTEYEIVQSAVRATWHGKEAHTFLSDKKTGAVWQMVCQPKSDVVEFQRVRRLGLDRSQSEPEQ
jgi:putative transposase